jgi:hypothetical protein
MGKFKQPTNIRTVGGEAKGKHSVSDEWPPRSYSRKYSLKSRVLTRVVEGEVYVQKYALEKASTTTIHRAGHAFMQDPDTVYAIGSVYGAKTVSFSKALIDPTFIPREYDED